MISVAYRAFSATAHVVVSRMTPLAVLGSSTTKKVSIARNILTTKRHSSNRGDHRRTASENTEDCGPPTSQSSRPQPHPPGSHQAIRRHLDQGCLIQGSIGISPAR